MGAAALDRKGRSSGAACRQEGREEGVPGQRAFPGGDRGIRKLRVKQRQADR